MTDRFYLLTLMIFGCCDAFGSSELETNLKQPDSWIKDSRASSRPRKKFPNLVQREPNERRFSGLDSICRTKDMPGNEIDVEANWSSRADIDWPISHENKGDSLSWYHRSRSEPINDFDQGINVYDFNNRRLFWEPIFDGKIIGSVGSLFNEDIKNEANRERVERENMHNEALRKKYVEMLNDPVKLAELEQESANSPSHIDQLIRRSFAQKFDERIRKNAARKPYSRKRFDYTGSKRAGEINEPRSDSYIFSKIMNDQSKGSSESKTLKQPDNSVPRVQEMPMYLSLHQALTTPDKSRKNIEKSNDSVYPKFWVNPRMLYVSRLDEMNKKRWNSPRDSIGDVDSPINSLPILNLLSRRCDLGLYIRTETPSVKIGSEKFLPKESRDFDTRFDSVPKWSTGWNSEK